MERKFLVRAFVAIALLAAPAYSADLTPIGTIAPKNDLRPPMLIRPFSIQTDISLKRRDGTQSTKKAHSDRKTLYWVIGITAGAALAIGLTAAAQGKSPF
jgi:hypothetical protein